MTLTVGAVALFGGLAVWLLKGEWTSNPQYYHGWAVPVLALYLAWRRWESRPASQPSSGHGVPTFLLITLLLWLPIRFLREANLDWRFLDWTIMALFVACLMLGMTFCFGRSWARHFAFPILFLFAAVPWPTRVETLVVQNLTGVVVRLATEALRWFGYPAWASGNLIHLPTGIVGVEEACSGLRSFQTALVIGLFLGEYVRLTVMRRCALLAVAILAAVVGNVIRTVFLTTVTAQQGIQAADKWHDWGALGVLLLTFGVTVGASLWMRRAAEQERRADLVTPFSAGRFLPVWMGSLVIALLLGAELFTAKWYSTPQNAFADSRIVLPPALRPVLLSERVQSVLRFNQGIAGEWKREDGSQWAVYAFEWEPGTPGAALARYHSPEVCLPTLGLNLVGARELKPLEVAGTSVPLRLYRFDFGGRPLFAFFSFEQADVLAGADPFSNALRELSWRNRLRRAWRGQRQAAARMLQVNITGARSTDAIERDARQMLAQAIKLGGS